LRLLSYQQTSLCKYIAYTTNFPDYFITDEGTGSLFKAVSAADVKLTSHFDSKMYFVAEQASEQIELVYMELQGTACENRKMIWQNRFSILRMLPPGQPGLVSKEPPVLGVIAGELLYLIQCKKTEVQLRATKKCYAQIPVLFNNKDYCLEPTTKIIHPFCKPMPCSKILVPAFEDDLGAWTAYGEGFRPIPEPLAFPTNMSWRTLNWKKLNDYSKGGFYETKDLEALMALLHRTGKVEAVNYIVSDHSEVTPNGRIIIDQDIYGMALRKYEDGFWRIVYWFRSFGNWISSFFGFYVLILLCKWVFNRLVDFEIFRHVMTMPMVILTLCCPAVARYQTQLIVHGGRNRRERAPSFNEVESSSKRNTQNETVMTSLSVQPLTQEREIPHYAIPHTRTSSAPTVERSSTFTGMTTFLNQSDTPPRAQPRIYPRAPDSSPNL
jgi:hypothetical protein